MSSIFEKDIHQRKSTSFVNQKLREAIYTRSRLRKNFYTGSNKENEKSIKYNKTNVYTLERIF